MKLRNKEIFNIHADYCRVLANSNRLAIMACLDVREMSVSEIANVIELSLPAVSQHLAVLKSKQLVVSRKEGTKVFYSVADRRIVKACQLIRTVLIDSMKQRGEIAEELFSDDDDIIE